MLDDEGEKMTKLRKEHPEFASTRDFGKFKDAVIDEATVRDVIEEADKVLGEVEEQLRTQKAQYGDYQRYGIVGL